MTRFNRARLRTIPSEHPIGWVSVLAPVVILWACAAGCDPSDDLSEDAGPDPDAGPQDGGIVDNSDILFEPDRVIEIEVALDPDDWELIRHQERSILDIFGVGCLESPFESPFTYVPGTVAVDGVTVMAAGVRKKGFLGSLDDEKPSLKIKFDEYVMGQHVHGLDRLTLNNGKQDPSLIRQCIGYGLFDRAGVPAPRCNFAHVTVNDRDLGVYAHVESVKKRFLRRHFEDDEGQLYEGTLSDFREGWTGTFEKKTNKEVAVVALLSEEEALILFAQVPPEKFQDGTTAEVDWTHTMVLLMHLNLTTDESELVGVLGGGVVALDKASQETGAQVSGRISGPLMEFPF